MKDMTQLLPILSLIGDTLSVAVITLHTNMFWTRLSLILLLLNGVRSKCTKGETKCICVPDNYVKFEPPPNSPVPVSIGVDLQDIQNISDREFSITLNA